MDTRRITGTEGPDGFIEKSPAIEASNDLGNETQVFLKEIADPVGFERRVHARTPTELAIKLEILLPEETFRPCGFDGRTMDLSARGMKILVTDLPESFYRRLYSKTRYARVELNDPRLGGSFRIIGRIMWFAYKSNRTEERDGDCMLGVLFDTEDRTTFEKYAAFAEGIMAATDK